VPTSKNRKDPREPTTKQEQPEIEGEGVASGGSHCPRKATLADTTATDNVAFKQGGASGAVDFIDLKLGGPLRKVE
jgi:hypothetical protein